MPDSYDAQLSLLNNDMDIDHKMAPQAHILEDLVLS